MYVWDSQAISNWAPKRPPSNLPPRLQAHSRTTNSRSLRAMMTKEPPLTSSVLTKLLTGTWTPASGSIISKICNNLLNFSRTADATELEASFCYHGVDNSCDFISFTALQALLELFDRFDFLENEEKRMLLCTECHVGVMDGHHHLNVLRTLHQSPDRAL